MDKRRGNRCRAAKGRWRLSPDAKYLAALEPDRMLAGYRLRAGLEPKAKGYGGWDSVNGKQLTGHIAGHYLSAVSLMYAATGDPRFKERADYLVKELKEVQEKRGNGYLGAITDQQGTDGAVIFERVSRGDIRSGGFDLNAPAMRRALAQILYRFDTWPANSILASQQ